MDMQMIWQKFKGKYKVFIPEKIIDAGEEGHKDMAKAIAKSIFGEEAKVFFTDDEESSVFKEPEKIETETEDEDEEELGGITGGQKPKGKKPAEKVSMDPERLVKINAARAKIGKPPLGEDGKEIASAQPKKRVRSCSAPPDSDGEMNIQR